MNITLFYIFVHSKYVVPTVFLLLNNLLYCSIDRVGNADNMYNTEKKILNTYLSRIIRELNVRYFRPGLNQKHV